MSGLTALVLAGTRPGGDPLAQALGLSHKALIEIGGTTMLEHVVATLDAVAEITQIVLVADGGESSPLVAKLRAQPRRATLAVLPSAAGPSASVASALAALGTPLLVTTADHALLRSDWVREFIAAAPAELDVVVGVASKAAVLAAVPDTQRTYLRFADGEFSGCNLFLLQREAARGVIALWQRLEAERKHPVRMLRYLGFGFALRYQLGWLRSTQALARLGALAGARVGFVALRDGRAAIDVDKPSDLELVRRLVGETAR